MIYDVSLLSVGWAVGLFLVLTHSLALLKFNEARTAGLYLGRSRVAGVVVMLVAGAWAVWLMSSMDLGEFTHYREKFVFFTLVGLGLTIGFVPEFLFVRALGMILLLLANILLDASFLSNIPAKLAITSLAYVWIVAGICLVGIPYWWRDILNWFKDKKSVWNFFCWFGIVYGIILVAFSILFYSK